MKIDNIISLVFNR